MTGTIFTGVREKWRPLYEKLKSMAEQDLGAFEEYKTTKGAIQFPLSKPIPYDLIEEITRFRVKDSMDQGKNT